MDNTRKMLDVYLKNENIRVKDDRSDERISNIISFVIFVIFLINLYSGLEGLFKIPHSYISLIGKLAIAAILFSNIMPLINRINMKIILLLFFTIFIACCNLFFFPNNHIPFMNIFMNFLTMCLPIMICIYSIKDIEILFRSLEHLSYVVGAIVLVSIIVFNIAGLQFNNNEYAMGFGASILLPTCFLIKDALNKKKIAKIFAISNILAIVFYGSRGPLFSIGIWLILYLYQSVTSKNISRTNKIWFTVLILIGTLTFIFLYFDGFKIIYQYLESKGIYNRTLYLFAYNFGHLSNRELLYKYFWDAIKASPFTIRGIGADRVALGAYPHNIIIELIYQLGILVAFPILILILTFSIKSIFNRKINSYSLLVTIFFCVGMALRFISGTLWEDMYFWGWIAIITKRGDRV